MVRSVARQCDASRTSQVGSSRLARLLSADLRVNPGSVQARVAAHPSRRGFAAPQDEGGIVAAPNVKQPRPIRPVLRPGCVAFSISSSRKNAGGAERRWTLPLERDPPLPKAANLRRGRHATECVVADNTRAYARRRSTTQTSLRQPALLLRRFLSPNRFR